MRIVAMVILVLNSSAAAAQELGVPPLERVFNHTITLKIPVAACTVPDLTAFVAKALDVPAGVEYLPGRCDYKSPRPQPAEEVPLVGRTFHDILDLLVKADPRFYWTESDGVVIMRPMAAWSARDHFLHRSVERLELKEQNMGAALDVLLPSPHGNSGTGEKLMATDPTLLTLTVTARSLVESLEAVVRTHKHARWEVRYCLPEMRAEVATVSIYSYDGRGLGSRAAFERDAEGRVIDRCRSRQ